MVRHIGLLILALSVAAVTGCHAGCCSKRASEKKCPTDIRKTHCWCFGEDALFRYPCGPNRVFYGHKATCWREWPASGSQWRDMHCPPPVVPGMMPHGAEVVPEMPMTAPAPAEGEIPDPYRDEAGQGTPAGQMEAPNALEPGAAEPNALPAVPENSGRDVPAIPPQDGAPEQQMPQEPMSSDGFEPMASASGESRPMGTAHVAGDASPPFAPVRSTARIETGSRWRLVVHDNPDGIAADGSDNAPLFRPPGLGGNQAPAPQAQKPAPRKRSLEEQTGDALKQFMSVR
jgi:hypothetical protein